MPDEVSTIGVRLTLDASGFSSGLEAAGGELNAFQKQASQAGSGVGGLKAGNKASGKTPGSAMPVDVTLSVSEGSIAQLRKTVAAGLVGIPVTINPQFAASGRNSVQGLMGSVLSTQYGITPQQGRLAAVAAIERAQGSMPKKALGGPVEANRPIIVGEHRPEVIVPKTASIIHPSIKDFYRKQEEVRRFEIELAAVDATRQRQHDQRIHAMAGKRVRPGGFRFPIMESETDYGEPMYIARAVTKGRRPQVVGESYIARSEGKIVPTGGIRTSLGMNIRQMGTSGPYVPYSTQVDKGYRRQGLAGWMYRAAERYLGEPLIPSTSQTPMAEGLWRDPSRPFGGELPTFVPQGQMGMFFRPQRPRRLQGGLNRVFSSARIDPVNFDFAREHELPRFTSKEMGKLLPTNRPYWSRGPSPHAGEVYDWLRPLLPGGEHEVGSRNRGVSLMFPPSPRGYDPNPLNHMLRLLSGEYGSGDISQVYTASMKNRITEMVEEVQATKRQAQRVWGGEGYTDWPSPVGFFHTTTNLSGVLGKGLLSGDELGGSAPGLGGNTKWVSTTWSLARARQIASSLRMMARIARNEVGPDQAANYIQHRFVAPPQGAGYSATSILDAHLKGGNGRAREWVEQGGSVDDLRGYFRWLAGQPDRIVTGNPTHAGYWQQDHAESQLLEGFREADAALHLGYGQGARSEGAYFVGGGAGHRDRWAPVDPQNIGVVQLATRRLEAPHRNALHKGSPPRSKWDWERDQKERLAAADEYEKAGMARPTYEPYPYAEQERAWDEAYPNRDWIEHGILPGEYEMRLPSRLLSVIGRRQGGGRASRALEARAIRMFGLTENLSEAGYVTPTGKFLDFSGRHEAGGYKRKGDFWVPTGMRGDDYLAYSRNVDHRQAWPLFENLPQRDGVGRRIVGGPEAMDMMIARGYARIFNFDTDQGLVAGTISRPFTEAQMASISEAARWESGGNSLQGLFDVQSRAGDTLGKVGGWSWDEESMPLGRAMREANKLALRRRMGGGFAHAMAGKKIHPTETLALRRAKPAIADFIRGQTPYNLTPGALKASMDFRDWYAIARAQGLGDMADFNYQGDPTIGLLSAASLSPGMPWPKNRALFRQLLQGVPPEQMGGTGIPVPGFGSVGIGIAHGRDSLRMAHHIFAAPNVPEALARLKGPKVNPFGLNLTGLDPDAFTGDRRMWLIATKQALAQMKDSPMRRGLVRAYEDMFRQHGPALGARTLSEFQAILWSNYGRGDDLGNDWSRTPTGIAIPRHPGIHVPVRQGGGFVRMMREMEPILGAQIAEEQRRREERRVRGGVVRAQQGLVPGLVPNLRWLTNARLLANYTPSGYEPSVSTAGGVVSGTMLDAVDQIRGADVEHHLAFEDGRLVGRATGDAGSVDPTRAERPWWQPPRPRWRSAPLGHGGVRGEPYHSMITEFDPAGTIGVHNHPGDGDPWETWRPSPADIGSMYIHNQPEAWVVTPHHTLVTRASASRFPDPLWARDFASQTAFSGARQQFPGRGTKELGELLNGRALGPNSKFWHERLSEMADKLGFEWEHYFHPRPFQGTQMKLPFRGMGGGAKKAPPPWLRSYLSPSALEALYPGQGILEAGRPRLNRDIVGPPLGFNVDVRTPQDWLDVMGGDWSQGAEYFRYLPGGHFMRPEVTGKPSWNLYQNPEAFLTGWRGGMPFPGKKTRKMVDGGKAYEHPSAYAIDPADLLRHQEPEMQRMSEWENPRYMRSLKDSILSEGFNNPIDLRLRDDGSISVYDGNHRIRAALDLKLPHVPATIRGPMKGSFFDWMEPEAVGIKRWMPKRAGGGESPKGLYIVGEIGKELFVPNSLAHLIPKKVMDQIPKAAGGMQVIGTRRDHALGGELFAPPEDGIIVPNRLMDQVPHAAEGARTDLYATTRDLSTGRITTNTRVGGEGGSPLPVNVMNWPAAIAQAQEALAPAPPAATGRGASRRRGAAVTPVMAGGAEDGPMAVPPEDMEAEGSEDMEAREGHWEGTGRNARWVPSTVPRRKRLNRFGVESIASYEGMPGPFETYSRERAGEQALPGGPKVPVNRYGVVPIDMMESFPGPSQRLTERPRPPAPPAPPTPPVDPWQEIMSIMGRRAGNAGPAVLQATSGGASADGTIAGRRASAADRFRAAGQRSVERDRRRGLTMQPNRLSFDTPPEDEMSALEMYDPERARLREEQRRGIILAGQATGARTPRGKVAQIISGFTGGAKQMALVQEQSRALSHLVTVENRLAKGGVDLKGYEDALEKVSTTTGLAKDEAQAYVAMLEKANPDLKAWNKANEANNEAVRKGIPGLKDSFVGLGKIVAGIWAYSKVMEGVGLVTSAAAPAAGSFIDQMRGWRSISGAMTTEIGKQTKETYGNVQAVMSQRATTAGLSREMYGFVDSALSLTASVKAGAMASTETESLMKASMGVGKGAPQGLFGGYGGLLETGLFAEQFGGGKGYSETMAGTLTAAQGGEAGWAEDALGTLQEGAQGFLDTMDGINTLMKSGPAMGVENAKRQIAGQASLEQQVAGSAADTGFDLWKMAGEMLTSPVGMPTRGLGALADWLGNKDVADELGRWNFSGLMEGGQRVTQQAVNTVVGTPPPIDYEARRQEGQRQLAAIYAQGRYGSLDAESIKATNAFLAEANQNAAAGYELMPTVDREGGLTAGSAKGQALAPQKVTFDYATSVEEVTAAIEAATDAGDKYMAGKAAESKIVMRVGSETTQVMDKFTGQMRTVVGHIAKTGDEYISGMAQGAVGAGIPDISTWAVDNRRALEASFASIRLGSEREAKLQPFSMWQQLTQNPLIRPGAAFMGSGSAGSMRAAGITDVGQGQQWISDIQAGRVEMQATATAGREAMYSDIASNLGTPEAEAWSELADAAEATSGEIASLTTDMMRLQQQAGQASWANQIRIAERSLGDAVGMLGRVGGTRLGYLQREEWLTSRASQSLGLASQKIGLASQNLSLMLQARSIATNLAVAQFQAPGETGEERYARQREAIIRAGIEKQQLGYGQQQFGISQEQYGLATKQFVTAGQIWSENARRGAVDAGMALSVMRQARNAEGLTIVAQQAIAEKQQRLAQTFQRMDIIQNRAGQNFGQALSHAAQNASQFSGDIAAASKVILESVGLERVEPVGGGRGRSSGTIRQNRTDAAGSIGTYSTPMTAVFGEAGTETVAILRNPRMGTMNLGGGGIGPMNLTVNINNPSVRNDRDIHSLARMVAAEVERSLGRKGEMLGLRQPAV